MESVEVVQYHHVERSGGRPFFLVAAYVKVRVVGATICQAMNECRVAVIGKDDRLVGREEYVKIFVTQTVRMFTPWLELHQIHNVNHADFQFGEMLPQQLNGGQSFKRRHVPGAGHHDIRFATLVVARPVSLRA